MSDPVCLPCLATHVHAHSKSLTNTSVTHAHSRDDTRKLHLKPGKMDVVFVLDDWVEELQQPETTPADKLLGIVGQVELKTQATFKVW